MDKFTIIRLLENGYSQRRVAKELKMSRQTVSRYWKDYQQARTEATLDPTNVRKKEAIVATPSYDTSKRQPRKYTSQIDQRIEELLKFDQLKKKQLGTHKQQLTIKAIHEILQSEGFDIAESTLRPYVREKLQRVREAYIKQVYPLGYRTEFDFGEIKLLIDGKKTLLFLAVFSCPASGYRWAYLYESSGQQVFIDAHIRFFKHLQGVFTTVVYDNMRNVVKRFVGSHEKELNDELLKLALYYQFEPVVTNTYSGHEKGHVEKSVQVIRRRAFTKQYEFASLNQAQEKLTQSLLSLNHSTEIEQEKQTLKASPSPYEFSITTQQRVDKYSFILVQGNFYSVPDYLVGEEVTVKRYVTELKIARKGHVITSHLLTKGTKQYVVDIRHYLPTLQKKPKAVEHSLVLKQLPLLRQCFLRFYKNRPWRFLQLVEINQELSLPQLIKLLEVKSLEEESPSYRRPSKAVNEARNQLQQYNVLHQVMEGAAND